mgnify:CR=1 FL=1
MADTVLKASDPFYENRKSLLKRDKINEKEPYWSITHIRKYYSQQEQEKIALRWVESDKILGISKAHVETLVTAFPSSRQGHRASFDAARRNYPIYEPFMSLGILDLGFKIPIEHKLSRSKYEFYRPYLDGYIQGLLHPDAAKTLRDRINNRYRDIPRDNWPNYAKYQTAWGGVRTDKVKELELKIAKSKKSIKQVLHGDYSLVPDNLIYQAYNAIIRTNGRIK